MSESEKYSIFFYEAFEEEAEAIKKYMPQDIKAGYSWKTIQESGHVHPPAEIISTRTQSKFPMDWADKLSAILSRSTGFDHLLNYKITTKTVAKLGYLPLYCNRAVAEQAMMLWMALLRKLPRQIKNFNKFKRDGLTGYECEGKKLLVVGVGNIGSQVVNVGKGLGMQVRGVDLIQKYPEIKYGSFSEEVPDADIIVCAMNLTSENIGYFNYETLKQAKPGVIFINIARGELSPIFELLKLIDEGHLGGLGLDVFEDEVSMAHALRNDIDAKNRNIDAVKKLSGYNNVILTPHNAFNTVESVERKAEQSVRQVKSFLEFNKFEWSIPEQD